MFDCVAEYGGTLLNKELLQGPDLKNSLVGVLTHFHDGPIAMMADIEAMFHQVMCPGGAMERGIRHLWVHDRDQE